MCAEAAHRLSPYVTCLIFLSTDTCVGEIQTEGTVSSHKKERIEETGEKADDCQSDGMETPHSFAPSFLRSLDVTRVCDGGQSRPLSLAACRCMPVSRSSCRSTNKSDDDGKVRSNLQAIGDGGSACASACAKEDSSKTRASAYSELLMRPTDRLLRHPNQPEQGRSSSSADRQEQWTADDR